MTNRQRTPRLKVVKSGPVTESAGDARLAPPPPMHVVETPTEVRQAKVAALKAAIATGAYEVDPDQVAKEILKHGL